MEVCCKESHRKEDTAIYNVNLLTQYQYENTLLFDGDSVIFRRLEDELQRSIEEKVLIWYNYYIFA